MGSRCAATLRFIMPPQMHWLGDQECGVDFFWSLPACEAIVSEYISSSVESLSFAMARDTTRIPKVALLSLTQAADPKMASG